MPEKVGLIKDIKLGSWLAGSVNAFDVCIVTLQEANGGSWAMFLWNSRADVMGSIANYLAKSGWRGGETWGQPVAVRLPLVEAALKGAPLADAVERVRAADVRAALAPIDDVRATAAYRREAAVELVRRAVAGVLA